MKYYFKYIDFLHLDLLITTTVDTEKQSILSYCYEHYDLTPYYCLVYIVYMVPVLWNEKQHFKIFSYFLNFFPWEINIVYIS